MKQYIAAVALAFAASAPALAQAPAPPGSDPKAADRAVVQYLVSDSVGEIALCREALAKTQNAAVKAFANRMIADHTQAIAEATAVAKAQNLGPIDAKASEDATVELAHLQRYTGHMFDENFLMHNQEDHLNDIGVVRHEAEISQSPAVKALDDKQVALLETHLMLTEQTMDAVAQSE